MKNDPLITIVTVCYNSGRTLRKTMESVLAQGYQNWEYIIIDGASNDDTVDIVNEYQKSEGRIKLISESDKGIYDAMNKGIQMAAGDIIGLINSDDWYERNTLELIANSFRKYGSGVYYGFQRYLKNGQEQYVERAHINSIASKMIQHPTCFVTTDIYKKYGAFDLQYKYSADLELMIRFVRNKVPFHMLDNILANFAIGGASSSRAAMLESIKIRHDYGLMNDTEYKKKKFKLSFQKALKI